MSHKDNVKKLYSLGHAGWYDPFRKIWTNYVSKKAEKEFMKKLKRSLKKDSKILELGCGTGINIERIRNLDFKSYNGLDFSEDMLAIARKKSRGLKKISLARKDLTEKPDKDKYDMIISTWVLSHINRPSKVVNNYYQQLKPKGKMLLIFLTKPRWYINLWFYPLARLFTVRYVSDKEMRKMQGIKNIKKYSLGMTTLLEIERK